MNLEEKSEQNLEYIIYNMGKMLQVVNDSIMNPKDYDLNNYEELKALYDLLKQKGKLTVAEIQAFIAELRQYRK
ncbi:hypothetical protein JCM21714_616 [Gracilibacillus boraciitolerans JCM 21714]|uniref:DUF1128 domain-containing protein n=1 Tax=Gracilibacillus boraciitolerans JCM 21714 TaxID=1298598 RepID=W4VFR5_9BACI|nr:DUF1128 family protein [Gracilibacillus boraciitolerans]GAE91663.1 hypothetical protein JCM21714_616 [Gracilibacillus boraciitolerans JCM 21714]